MGDGHSAENYEEIEKVKVLLRSTLAHPDGGGDAGKVVEIPVDVAEQLVKEGHAEFVKAHPPAADLPVPPVAGGAKKGGGSKGGKKRTK